ncbi:transglutaminaseTgpA domain-containing protein [Fimbriiglobus ruber]|uniref:Transglutaminase-like enzyme, putative cysteine protease n=1 Tax=Fimbriiglobus ruber TaxID=1908690 RepID=A0A225ED52_9BACT|nr:DUF3488 and transglutaminase-like domain-containing protein [Fimbriiglobus ruber]OWK46375.1 Transglutaminase-like enzyme, putative cysteine protease [Fimbriiglobus ruber]
MPTHFTFRLSTYLTLALACLCMGYSEWEFLREGSVCAGIVIVLLAVSFRTGSRYELSLRSANRVGFVIGSVAALWLAYQFANRRSLIYTLPWPASLLPYLAPLIMVLMPAKLFRPKHVGDWWAMQGIGLAGVGLASSMAEDEMFGLLFAMYTVAAVWSLTLFFFRREAGELPAVPNTTPGPVPVLVTSGTGTGFLGRALGWLAVAAVISLPLFFATPRSAAARWRFVKPQIETGMPGDQTVDLDRTGELRINRDVAFEVRATYPDGRPKVDLSPGQRWRGVSFNQYTNGKWTRVDMVPLMRFPLQLGLARQAWPDFGPSAYYLDFRPTVPGGIPVLADPVLWEPRQSAPVATVVDGHPQFWLQDRETVYRLVGQDASRPVTEYRQKTRPPSAENPDLGPPFEPADTLPDAFRERFAIYRAVNLPRVGEWTREMLRTRAQTDDRLRAAIARAADRNPFEVVPEDYELIARVCEAHLAHAGGYSYTLKLRRDDRDMDPIEEFLLKTKTGHCERFAAGLALMLRTVGVPAVYVLGYKGFDTDGDGTYLIRQEHAHAWVEVLVRRPAPPDYIFHPRTELIPGAPRYVWHWLSVDPNPASEEVETDHGMGDWFSTVRATGAAFFLDFIVGYNPDRRKEAAAAIGDLSSRGGTVAILVLGIVILGSAGRWVWKNRHRVRGTGGDDGPGTTGLPWFDRYQAILSAHGHSLESGATVREHAAAVAAALADSAGTAGAADVPVTVAKAFYAARYAGQPPEVDELTRLERDLSRLEKAMRTARKE